jgi:hypothetical protein
MKAPSKILLLFILFLVLYQSILYLTIGKNQPLWADEHHFIITTKEFSKEISLSQLKHYNEMSTPLPFILYSLWGKLCGFQLHHLRLFSIIIGFITIITYYFLFRTSIDHEKTAIILTIFLTFQPYMIGLMIFVYTDMLTMLFLALALIALRKKDPILFTFSSCAGLLCRQYFAFLLLAAIFYFLFRILILKDKHSYKMITSAIISAIPLLMLFLLWNGFSPQNKTKISYLEKGLYFHPSFLVMYISLLFVYLLPIIIYYWNYFYKNYRIVLLSLLPGFIYFLFPVKASEPAVAANVLTVGFFHRFTRKMIGQQWEQLIFFITFVMSLPILFSFGNDLYHRWKNRIFDFMFLLDLSVFSFLLIMPFSYLNWEKYLLPLIPVTMLQITLKNFRGSPAE